MRVVTAHTPTTRLPSARERFYRPELDILRLLAFCMVFIGHLIPAKRYHFHVVAAVKEASSFGVPVFFALSAYLITDLLFREKDSNGNINFPFFYFRRVLRIWPLYVLALLGAFVLSRLIPGTEPVSLGALLAYLFLAGNWHAVVLGPLQLGFGVLWSIGVEEQFYLVWPALVRFASRRTVVLASAVIWGLSQMAVALLCSQGAIYRVVWYNTLVHMQYFAIGAAFSSVLRGRAPRIGSALRLFLIISGMILFGLIRVSNTSTSYLPYLSAGVGTGLIFAGFLGMHTPAWTKPLQYLGTISYGLYIYHFVVLELIGLAAEYFLHMHHGVYTLKLGLGLPLTVLIAHLSYKYFEMPFLRLKARFEIVKSRPICLFSISRSPVSVMDNKDEGGATVSPMSMASEPEPLSPTAELPVTYESGGEIV